jgi:hypothetical protein
VEARRGEGDSAYRGPKRRIGRAANRNRERSRARKAANTTRAKRRARVAHVFGDRKNSMGIEIVRTTGIVPARARSA